LISGIKEAKEVKVGDTITDAKVPTQEGISGFEDVKPMVFAGIYPLIPKITKNSGIQWKSYSSTMPRWCSGREFGSVGFWIQMRIFGHVAHGDYQERLEREFDMTVITTVPNVSYLAYTKKDPEKAIVVNNPSDMPDPSRMDRVEEPYIKATIITKSDFVGNVMSLCIEKRGLITNQTYLTTERVELNFDMPLAEIVFDFYDRLKTVSKGYASFDYHPIGMRASKLVKVDVLLNGNGVDALSA
jgi:GTP-binding protein LepA